MSAVLEHDWFPRPLPDRVTFGEGTWIYSSFAFVHDRSDGRVTVGRHSGVYNGSFFDLGESGEVRIGDYCTVVGAVFATNGLVVIEDFAFIAHEVTVADTHAATPGPAVPAVGPGIVIGENAWIGARAVLLSGARIGRNAVVGAATVIDGEVPDGAIVAGNPYRVVGRAA
jgi:acetyltransferase-like isoleucine patch superfamily enzyme